MRTRFLDHCRRLSALALQNSSRNLLVSGATVLMMALILFILNVVGLLSHLTQGSLEAVGKQVDLIVYLNDDVTLTEVSSLMDDLKKNPRIATVEYTDKMRALNEFLETYPEEAAAFTEFGLDNPLPASLHIVSVDPRDHALILSELQNSRYKSLINANESNLENESIVKRLIELGNFTEKLLWGVGISFILGTLLLMINAVHLSLFHRKTELEIMQWVGASRSMILGPFLVEAAFSASAAWLLSLFLLLAFTGKTQFFQLQSIFDSTDLALMLGGEWVLVLLVSVSASAIASNIYLKRS